MQACPTTCEHRLYQADWLLRYYGFCADELVDESMPNLESDLDPKTGWALRHLELFPVEINRADYQTLLRIPGIGVRSARRIVRARRQGHLAVDDLAKLGVIMKRARYFITARGRFIGDCSLESRLLRLRLAPGPQRSPSNQLDLPFLQSLPNEDSLDLISGEL